MNGGGAQADAGGLTDSPAPRLREGESLTRLRRRYYPVRMRPRSGALGVPMLALLLTGVAGCLLGMIDPGPHWPSESAFTRAAKEFSCPYDQIAVLERKEISADLFDVEACGQRARYHCQPTTCIREPDPARWDPDPVLCRSPDAVKGKPASCKKRYRRGD